MRIGIANGSPLAAEALRRAVTLSPANEVIWTARDGDEAVDLCARSRPELLLMDLIMPVMDGVEATRRIMAQTPCAILIVTADVEANVSRVFEAMGYGALDAVDTPALGYGDAPFTAEPLLAKIAAIAKLLRERASAFGADDVGDAAGPSQRKLLAIGASAGGPAAVAAVLDGLPTDFPAAVVVVQHVDERFAAGMAEWLNSRLLLPVRLAVEGDPLRAGTVLMAGTGDHLALRDPNHLGYTADPRDYAYRPSVDVFFQSVCRRWRGPAVGVLLTGMGRDGAVGLKAMRDRGCYTIAQDKATSAVYGMPKAAAALAAAVDILPLPRIGAKLLEIFAERAKA